MLTTIGRWQPVQRWPSWSLTVCLCVQVAGMASRSLVRPACWPARARVVRVHTGCRGVCRAVGAPAAHTPPKPGCTSNSSPDGRRHHRVGAPRTRTHDIEHSNCEQEPNIVGSGRVRLWMCTLPMQKSHRALLHHSQRTARQASTPPGGSSHGAAPWCTALPP